MVNEYLLTFYDPPGCPLFEYIKNGVKTVEGRKNSPKNQQIMKDDVIIFINEKTGEKLIAKVTYIHKYNDVLDYLKKETLSSALPCVKTYKDGVALYNEFSDPEERKSLRDKYGYGFLGIGIQVL